MNGERAICFAVMQEDAVVNKYIRIYHKRNIVVAAIGSTFVFAELLLLALFTGRVAEYIWGIISPFALAAIGVLLASLSTIRFGKMIKKQEQLYHVEFEDANTEQLEKTLFLSERWLIAAGNCAVYKQHIQSIGADSRYSTSYRILIKTYDGKEYAIWSQKSYSLRKIKRWLQTDLEKEKLESDELLKEILGDKGMVFLSPPEPH